MNVRKSAGTTFWLIVLFVGFPFLISVVKNVIPYEIIYPLEAQLHQQSYMGKYFPFVINLAMWTAIIAGTIDTILNNRNHFALLKSYNVLIVLAIPVIIAACIPSVTTYMFWGILQLTAILGTYWTFRKLIHNNRYGGQKLIPFIKEIKNTGGSPIGHISDHYIVWGVSLLLLAIFAFQVISLIVFVGTNWNEFV